MKLRPLLVLAICSPILTAQEVHIGPPAWLAVDDTPDELPVVRGIAPLEVTPELRAVSEPAYVEIRLSVSAKGEADSWASVATSPWLRRPFQPPSRQFVPAKRAGKAVASEIAVFHIYNPASASEKLSEATPRLLVVKPPVYPDRPPPETGEDPVVRVRVEIDTTGAVASAQAMGEVEEGFAVAAVAAVKRWEFAPARKAGQPVAHTMEVAVAFRAPTVYQNGEVHVSAKPIRRSPPIYPYTLRRMGVPGRVVLAFTVTVEGRVADAFVISSSHPMFEEVSLNAIREWGFTPAIKDGRPVAMKAAQLFEFETDGRTVQEFKVSMPAAWPPNVPEALRFDVPPKLDHMELPVYPAEDLLAGRKGKVTLAYVVGPDGRVSEVTALPGAPSPAMAAAAVAALQEWRFTPAGKQGRPSHALLRIEMEFSPDGGSGHAAVSDSARRMLRRMKNQGVDSYREPVELDQKLVMRTGSPKLKTGRKGEAEVEFILDRDGVPQLLRFVSATDEATGYAAVQAASRWRFTRPISQGKLVDYLMRVPVRFE
jgi:TonB family protein